MLSRFPKFSNSSLCKNLLYLNNDAKFIPSQKFNTTAWLSVGLVPFCLISHRNDLLLGCSSLFVVSLLFKKIIQLYGHITIKTIHIDSANKNIVVTTYERSESLFYRISELRFIDGDAINQDRGYAKIEFSPNDKPLIIPLGKSNGNVKIVDRILFESLLNNSL